MNIRKAMVGLLEAELRIELNIDKLGEMAEEAINLGKQRYNKESFFAWFIAYYGFTGYLVYQELTVLVMRYASVVLAIARRKTYKYNVDTDIREFFVDGDRGIVRAYKVNPQTNRRDKEMYDEHIFDAKYMHIIELFSWTDCRGYLQTDLGQKLGAHQLVGGIPVEGDSIDHVDGNKFNSIKSNLEIVSIAENTRRYYRNKKQGTIVI